MRTWASQLVGVVKNPPADAGDIRDEGLIPAWVSSLEESLATPMFLPRESNGQRSPAGYRPWSHKESNMTEVT